EQGVLDVLLHEVAPTLPALTREVETKSARPAELRLDHPPTLSREDLRLAIPPQDVAPFRAAVDQGDDRTGRAAGRGGDIGLYGRAIARLNPNGFGRGEAISFKQGAGPKILEVLGRLVVEIPAARIARPAGHDDEAVVG